MSIIIHRPSTPPNTPLDLSVHGMRQGQVSAQVISVDDVTGHQVVDAIVRAVSSVPKRIENAIYSNMPQSTFEQIHPQYQDQYSAAIKGAGIVTTFLFHLIDGTASALIGYGAYYFTGNVTVGTIVGGALYSALAAAAVTSGIFGVIKDAYYSNLDLQIRAINFIYDNGLSLHWHSLMLNAQSIWGSVTAEKLNNTPEDRWIHIHPRIVKRLPVKEFNDLDIRIKNKFRDEQKKDIFEHFSKLGAFDKSDVNEDCDSNSEAIGASVQDN